MPMYDVDEHAAPSGGDRPTSASPRLAAAARDAHGEGEPIRMEEDVAALALRERRCDVNSKHDNYQRWIIYY